jgi:SAM-dependent methyltransferase
MPFDRDHRLLFDRCALDYDAARPGYPELLIEAIAGQSALHADERILEIGCGTGQLTRPLAQRGYTITAIEIGEGLSRLAARNLAQFPNVTVIHADFERWGAEPGAYDWVACAQAFHWIDPEIGYLKAHEALRPEGRLALIWKLFPASDAPVYRALADVYRTHAPQLGEATERHGLSQRIERTAQEIAAAGLFEKPDVVRVPWTAHYTTSRYLQLLKTFSDHMALTPETFERLLDGVRQTLERFGGAIDRPQVAVLFVAPRCSQAGDQRTK